METKESIFLQNRQSLAEKLKEWKLPNFRSKQVTDWIFDHRVCKIEDLKNIPNDLKSRLSSYYSWELPKIVSKIEGDTWQNVIHKEIFSKLQMNDSYAHDDPVDGMSVG